MIWKLFRDSTFETLDVEKLILRIRATRSCSLIKWIYRETDAGSILKAPGLPKILENLLKKQSRMHLKEIIDLESLLDRF